MKKAGPGLVAVALALSLFATPAFAYIGPGAGITVLGAIWGMVVALSVLFRRRRKRTRPADAPLQSEADVSSPAP